MYVTPVGVNSIPLNCPVRMQLNIRHSTNFINTINICIGCGFVSLVLSWGQWLRHRDSWDTCYDTLIRNGGDRIVWCGNGNVGTQLIIITQTETSQGQARMASDPGSSTCQQSHPAGSQQMESHPLRLNLHISPPRTQSVGRCWLALSVGITLSSGVRRGVLTDKCFL